MSVAMNAMKESRKVGGWKWCFTEGGQGRQLLNENQNGDGEGGANQRGSRGRASRARGALG